MKFKNALVFRLEEGSFTHTAEDLASALEEYRRKPVGPQELSRSGFDAPLRKHSDELVHAANGCLLVCLGLEEKILPGAVVKERVEERAEAIEQEQSRKVRKKEKDEIKEQVMLEMLPNCFTKTTRTYGYVDTANNLLVVDAGSAKKAEDFASNIRKAIGSLKARPIAVENSPTLFMTAWLKDQESKPAYFRLGADASLTDPGEDAGKINIKNLDLTSEEINNHLDAGMVVNQLSLHFEDKMGFSLKDDLSIKSIKYGEVMNEELDNMDLEDPASKFDATFTISSGILAEAIAAVTNAFGGDVTFE